MLVASSAPARVAPVVDVDVSLSCCRSVSCCGFGASSSVGLDCDWCFGTAAARPLRVALTAGGFAVAEASGFFNAAFDPLAVAFAFVFAFELTLVATGLSARPFLVRAALVAPVVADADDAAAVAAVVLCRFALGANADGSLSMMVVPSPDGSLSMMVVPSPVPRFRDRVNAMGALLPFCCGCCLGKPIKSVNELLGIAVLCVGTLLV